MTNPPKHREGMEREDFLIQQALESEEGPEEHPCSQCGDDKIKWRVTEDLKKILKKIAIIKPDGLYTLNAQPTEANLAQYARANPDEMLLNSMPFDKALTAYAAKCGVSL